MKVCLYSHLLAFINTEGLLYTNGITGELTKHCVVHFPLTFSFKDLIYFPYLSYLKIMYSISILEVELPWASQMFQNCIAIQC